MAIYLYALEEFSAHLLETVTFGGPGLYRPFALGNKCARVPYQFL